MGFSQGAMVALAASGSTYSRRDGTEQAFRGIFSAYPICILKDLPMPGSPDKADFLFVPEKINVSILVAMGDQDNIGMSTTAADCKPMFDKRKAAGDPIILHRLSCDAYPGPAGSSDEWPHPTPQEYGSRRG
jgi:hypothetical protein